MNAKILRYICNHGKFPPTPSSSNIYQFERVLAKMLGRARVGGETLVVQTTDVVSKDYNIRGMLTDAGFITVNLPQKRILIMW